MDSSFPQLHRCTRVSLYIHVPFCTRKCAYCDFFSVAGADSRTVGNIIRHTLRQTVYFLERLSPDKLVSVYLGGGTPSCLPRTRFKHLLKELYSLGTGSVAEYTVEANPESLDEEFLEICAEFGVTRLSLGIQSFRPGLLKRIGRSVSAESIRNALRLINRYWHGDVNLDILAGLPGQSARIMAEDIHKVLSRKPTHISCYTLTLEQGTRLYKQAAEGTVRLPAGELQDELWLMARRKIVAGGYSHYEISNFALPGKECIHNMGYWLLNPYAGVGPGAVSTLPTADGGVARIFNPGELEGFLTGKNTHWGARWENLTPVQLFFEQLMLGFRLKSGIPASLFLKRFGRPLPEIIPRLWDSWCARGLIKHRSSSYALNLRGRLILNRLLGELAEHMPGPGEIKTCWP